MYKSAQTGSPRSRLAESAKRVAVEAGFAQVLVLLLLLVAIPIGVYAVQHQTNILPFASELLPSLTPIQSASPTPLTVSCLGQNPVWTLQYGFNWGAFPKGGDGKYVYSWQLSNGSSVTNNKSAPLVNSVIPETGTNGMTGAGAPDWQIIEENDAAGVDNYIGTPGVVKTATVTVTSAGQTATATCSTTLVSTNELPPVSCGLDTSITPQIPPLNSNYGLTNKVSGNKIAFKATVDTTKGLTGPFSYDWIGTDGLLSTTANTTDANNTVTQSYSTTGQSYYGDVSKQEFAFVTVSYNNQGTQSNTTKMCHYSYVLPGLTDSTPPTISSSTSLSSCYSPSSPPPTFTTTASDPETGISDVKYMAVDESNTSILLGHYSSRNRVPSSSRYPFDLTTSLSPQSLSRYNQYSSPRCNAYNNEGPNSSTTIFYCPDNVFKTNHKYTIKAEATNGISGTFVSSPDAPTSYIRPSPSMTNQTTELGTFDYKSSCSSSSRPDYRHSVRPAPTSNPVSSTPSPTPSTTSSQTPTPSPSSKAILRQPPIQ